MKSKVGTVFASLFFVISLLLGAALFFCAGDLTESKKQVADLQRQLSSCQSDLASCQSVVSDLEQKLSDTEEALSKKSRKITDMQLDIIGLQSELEFIQSRAVFVMASGPRQYHKSDCLAFRNSPDRYSGYYVYTPEDARSRGYDPCMTCCTWDVYNNYVK